MNIGIKTACVSSAPGMVENLARPSGNIIGIALLYDHIAVKWLELLHEAAPGRQSCRRPSRHCPA
jgi:hypothetical protein